MIDINKNPKKNLNKSKDDLSIFLPHEISDKERNEMFAKFAQIMTIGEPKPEDVFAVLYNYFSENEFNPYFIEKYYNTYWSIFVKLGWQLLPSLQDNIFANFVARTLPYAVSERVNVKDKLLTELFLMEPPAAKSAYDSIKRIIISLDYPISFDSEGKKILLSDLLKQLAKERWSDDTSRFGVFVQAQKALFPNIANDAEEVKKSVTQSAKDFIEMLRFFAISPDDVSEYAGDYYRNRLENKDMKIAKELMGELGANLLEEYALNEEGEKKPLDFAPGKEKVKPQTNEVNANFLAELAKHKNDFAIWITKAATLRSLLLWLGTFESKAEARKELIKNLEIILGKNSLSNDDLVLAVTHLDEFLAKNGYWGDDFIHFEEASGKFKWGK